MPILVKTDISNGIPEWGIIELQGDLDVRGDQSMNRQFIGDLSYDKYGQPILIIGHHILHGKEQNIDKPFAVLERIQHECDDAVDVDDEQQNVNNPNESLSTTINNRTVLDSTVAIEHKTKYKTEYQVRALIKKKVIFKSRPKPIIANFAKPV